MTGCEKEEPRAKKLGKKEKDGADDRAVSSIS